MSDAHAAPSDSTGARRAAHPALVLLIIAGAQLMVVLDGTIVNIALPSMGRYFNKSQTDMTWALNAYTLAFGGLLLLGGRSGDILGRRRMFMVGLGLFTVGSFAAGVSGDFSFLLAGRVVQGLGGAIAAPTALSLIANEFEEGPERTRAFGVYAAVSGAGAALGLLLGGILTNYFTWRWVLFVNVPIGIVLITAAYFYIHESERLQGGFDFIGSLLSVAGLVGVVYGFIHVANTSWGNAQTYLVFGAAVVLLVGFVVYERIGTDDPLMPMRIFDDRSRVGAYTVMLVVGAAMFGMFYFVTFFTQGVLGYSALKTGFAFLPVAVGIGVTSQVVARILPRFGPKPIVVFGTALLTVSLLWLSTVNADSSYAGKLLPGMLALAVAMGCNFVPLTVTAVSKVQNTDAGLASALLNVGQQVGGAIGLSVMATVFATEAKSWASGHITSLVAAAHAQLSPADAGRVLAAVQHAGKNGLEPDQIQALGKGNPSVLHFLQDGTYHRFAQEIQAHGSAHGFFTGSVFAIVALVAAAALIAVKKTDLPTGEVAVAAH
ncbi:MFS transporter [Jatrophihabitans sp.]|uniref:MFS transporter n=1 Tax=Jatrophihabitans sp. TaxID=1932789 RepID=UPI0030C6DFFD|nr:Drug resistance transporter, EmrB/QacA subfamily [Jatrophihabitans sp.]